MVLKADQERLRTLLKDTITLLCKNGLSFKSKFSVDALIGVTLDEDDVFLVSIREIIKSEISLPELDAAESQSDADSEGAGQTQNGKRRKRKRPKVKIEGQVNSAPEDNPENEDDNLSNQDADFDESSSYSVATAEPTTKRPHLQVKEEHSGGSGNDDDDIVFVKSELDDNWSQQTGDDANQSSMYSQDGNTMGDGTMTDQNFASLSGLDLVPLSQDAGIGMWGQPMGSSSQQRPYRPRISRTSMPSPGTSQSNPADPQNPDQQVGRRKLKCRKGCEVEFRDASTRKRHEDGPKHSDEPRYHCTCGKRYFSATAYRRHRHNHHGIPMTFACNECSYTTGNKFYLNDHMRRHTNGGNACPHCEKRFATKWGLRRHSEGVHGDKRYVCEQCGAAFTCQANRKKHMDSKHSQAQHVCVKCGRIFNWKSGLCRHAKTHC